MVWIDSHCHLDHASFKHDLPQVLSQAQALGIKKFIVPSVGFHQWEEQQIIQKEYPCTFHAFGVHPWFCDTHEKVHLEQLDDLLNDAIAVGECGLDFMPDKPSHTQQLWWFEAQLALAEKHDLPLIIHSVKAGDEISSCLKQHPKAYGVVHGFSGSLQQAQVLIQLGFLIAIGTRLVRANPNKTKDLVTQLPLSSILLETDAPDGLGQQMRNEPQALVSVAHVIAEYRQQQPEEVLKTCSQNAQELFQL